MIQGGYILQPRCIDNSWIAKSAPVVRETWAYLLRRANHAPRKYNGFIVKRGQVFISYSEIIEALSWYRGCCLERYSVNQMKHTMKLLREGGMIELTNHPRGNLITICNYDYYQNPNNYESTSESTNESTSGQPVVNQQPPAINKNVKNERMKEEPKEPSSSDDEAEFYLTKKGRKLTGKRLETFKQFWDAFNYKTGKAEAADAWYDIKELTASIVDTIISSAEKEASARPAIITQGKTPKMAQGWISGRRWEDEATDQNEKGEAGDVRFENLRKKYQTA